MADEYMAFGSEFESVADELREKFNTAAKLGWPEDYIARIRELTNTADTTATPASVASGEVFYDALGIRRVGTLSFTAVQFNTTAGWDATPELVGAENTLYVYTDHEEDADGRNIPGFKIGDGNAYLIDMPFSDHFFAAHINNTDVHITPEERAFWNNKERCYVTPLGDPEELIFTKN
ncbi:MAG: hypothetical protein IJL83_02290 [Clostridia bacterium]|nr:hypothetical protein [Clostridia bacterium]